MATRTRSPRPVGGATRSWRGFPSNRWRWRLRGRRELVRNRLKQAPDGVGIHGLEEVVIAADLVALADRLAALPIEELRPYRAAAE